MQNLHWLGAFRITEKNMQEGGKNKQTKTQFSSMLSWKHYWIENIACVINIKLGVYFSKTFNVNLKKLLQQA